MTGAAGVLAPTGPAIDVVGLGTGADTALGASARAAIEAAEVVVGADRHLAAVVGGSAERLSYPTPFGALAELLGAREGRRICLLASGDPLLHGVGAWLCRHVAAERLVFHPNVSSVQAAAARAGLPWADAEIVSLHGRPPERVRARLRAGRLLAVLGDDRVGPARIATELAAAGLGASRLWVAERLGTADERFAEWTVDALCADPPAVDPLHLTLVRTDGPGGVLPEFPGLPDGAFATGEAAGRGLITKRDVRLAALSRLAPRAGETGWDVGAGCGSVTVEWARWNPLGHVHAIERDADRLRHLHDNVERFGVSANVTAHHATAPDALDDLPDPDAVFVGGGGTGLGALLERAWSRLRPGGRLVATGVTEPARATLGRFADDHDGDCTEITVARGGRLDGQLVLRPQLPVLVLVARHPGETR